MKEIWMSSQNKPVVVVGSINMDLVATTARIPRGGETVMGRGFQTHPGGKGANQAAAVARLGYPVEMVGRLGDDGFGLQLRSALEDAGVDASAVMATPGSSGCAVIVVSDAGENCIVVVAGANALLTAADIDAHRETIRGAGMVLAQLEIPLETVMHLARMCAEEGVALMVDPAPARELPRELLELVDWFTPNETEAAFYLGSETPVVETSDPATVAEGLRGLGVKRAVLKRGSRGAWVSTGEMAVGVKAFAVKAVDTTAAGDAFNGAFAVALMRGQGAEDAARFAAAAAAVSVTRAGAQGSMATTEEVEEMMKTDGGREHV
jgi:ribokinase